MSGICTRGIRLASAAATVAITALSLTACGDDGTGVRAATGGTSHAGSTVPTGSASVPGRSASPSVTNPASSKAPDDSTGSGGSKSTTPHATSTAAASSGKPVTCEGSNTRTVAAPLNRPVNHMLLTVTNTGSTTCYLYGYPALQFTGAQAVPPVIAASHPQAVVTLNPGQSGYALVNLSAADGSGTNGNTAKTLAVNFSGRSGNESVGTAAHPSLPAKGLYIDSTLRTTYWQQSMDDALSW